MTGTACLVDELVCTAGLAPHGFSGGALRQVVGASEEEFRAALGLCLREGLLRRELSGMYRVTSETAGGRPNRRKAQALVVKIRRVLLRQSGSPEALELAHVLLRLEIPVSAQSMKAIAELCEFQRRDSPERVQEVIEAALGADDAGSHKQERYQLALTHVACLSANVGDSVWRAAFDALFAAAIAVGDLRPLLETLRYRVTQLRESAQHRQAEAELRHALTLMSDDDEARIHIHMLLAQCQIYRGQAAFAHTTLQTLIAESESKGLPQSVEIIESINGLAALLLAEGALQRLEQQLKAAIRRGDDSSASVAASLAADLSLIYGNPGGARVLAREAALRGTRLGRGWRDASRAVIEASLALSAGEIDEFENLTASGMEIAGNSGNRFALRRLCTLKLRHAILRGARDEVGPLFHRLMDDGQNLEPVYTAGDAGLAAAAELALGRIPMLRSDLSVAGTYTGLGGVLAALDTAAIVGPRGSAVALWRWSEDALQRSVVTAVDWPVLLERVAALVALRLGKRQHIGDRLSRSIQRADDLGYRVEGAIARLQYAEIAEAAGLRVKGESITSLREKAIEYLLTLGYQPEPIALLATQAWIRGSASRSVVDLSKREAEVLQVMAAGHTYRGTAERLGISWRTVQTQAKHAYAKLGASGKHDAIAIARRRGEI